MLSGLLDSTFAFTPEHLSAKLRIHSVISNLGGYVHNKHIVNDAIGILKKIGSRSTNRLGANGTVDARGTENGKVSLTNRFWVG